MAHIENSEHHRISGETSPIRIGQPRTIYVWGGDFNGNPLSVTSSDPNVLAIQEITQPNDTQANYRKFRLTARRDADSVTVSISPSSDSSQVWDSITLLVHTNAESGQYYRDRVISIARQHLGAHYLWGAAGACPDQLNGMPRRPGSVSILTLASPDRRDIQNSVAVSRVSGFCTCAGKPSAYGVATPYMNDSAGLDLSAETAERSYRTVYKSYSNPHRKGIVLGERCENKRHFDCVGFINYCLSMALGTSMQMEISGNAANHYRGYANAFAVIPNNQPHQAGDILIFGGTETEVKGRKVIGGAHHIGFSLGDGRQMIHAAETECGVVITGIGNPIRRVRHPILA